MDTKFFYIIIGNDTTAICYHTRMFNLITRAMLQHKSVIKLQYDAPEIEDHGLYRRIYIDNINKHLKRVYITEGWK